MTWGFWQNTFDKTLLTRNFWQRTFDMKLVTLNFQQRTRDKNFKQGQIHEEQQSTSIIRRRTWENAEHPLSFIVSYLCQYPPSKCEKESPRSFAPEDLHMSRFNFHVVPQNALYRFEKRKRTNSATTRRCSQPRPYPVQSRNAYVRDSDGFIHWWSYLLMVLFADGLIYS